MGTLHYGSNDAGVSVQLSDEILEVVSGLIQYRFVEGETAGRPFVIQMTGGDDVAGVELYVSSGVPLWVSFDDPRPDQEASREMREYFQSAKEGLDKLGILIVPGMESRT